MLNRFSLLISAAIVAFVLGATFSLANAESELDLCRQLPRDQIAPPTIYIYEIEQRGTRLQKRYRIKGFYEGVCLSEVGVFEDGRRVQKLNTITRRTFKRVEFLAQANVYKNPEIRAYTVHGDRVVAQIKPKNISPSFDFSEIEIFITPKLPPRFFHLK